MLKVGKHGTRFKLNYQSSPRQITLNSRHLDDDACGWDASGIHTTLNEIGRKRLHRPGADNLNR